MLQLSQQCNYGPGPLLGLAPTYARTYAVLGISMTGTGLSKTLLTQFLNAADNYSASLDPHEIAPNLRVIRQTIAQRAFGTKGAPQRLSELEQQNPHIGKQGRHAPKLSADKLECILDAARELLGEQFALHGKRGRRTPAEFEAHFCQTFGFRGPKLRVEDFDFHGQPLVGCTPAQLGFPDMVTWQNADLMDDLVLKQDASLEWLPRLKREILFESNPAEKLHLVYLVVGLAALHHPGQQHHDWATTLAHEAASNAGVFELSRSKDDDVRLQAIRIRTQLAWACFLPHINSPTNYLPLVLARTPLSSELWRRIEPSIDQAIALSREQLLIAPSDPTVVREYASTSSIKARFRLARDLAPSDESERLHVEAMEVLGSNDMPYALLYPILRDSLLGRWNAAIEGCTRAIERHASAYNLRAESAFGALMLHLTALESGRPTADTRIRALAHNAVASQSMHYQFSHVFDIASVSRLLPRRRNKSLYRVRKRR